jgi:tetratricopeptide (TPR) repeat protein
MNIKCKLGFHTWNGCICSKCGIVRDEQHDWKKDCEKCSKCGKPRVNQHDWNGCKCSKCGITRDEQHNWKKNCEKCSKCGKTKEKQHQWDGCKCTKCGKTRDEQHDWSKDCGKCSQCGKTSEKQHHWDGCKCTKCGKNRDEEHDWSKDCEKCSICGKTISTKAEELKGDIVKLAHSFVLNGQFSEAIQIYRQAIAISPNNDMNWSNLGTILFSFVEKNFVPYVGSDIRIVAILGDSQLVSDITRDLWFKLVDRQHCYGLKICLDEAEKCWRKAIELNPNGGFWARAFLIQFYERMAYFEKAQLEFEQAELHVNKIEERNWLNKEEDYFRTTKSKDIDAILRPKTGTAVGPIHEIYGEELRKVLNKTEQNFHDWSKDCEKCSKCSRNRENQHSWEGSKCSKCGKEKNDRQTINK